MAPRFFSKSTRKHLALLASVGYLSSFTISPLALAQGEINLEEVRKEFAAAQGDTAESSDSFSLKEGDLQKRRSALLAAENALLNELQTPETSDAAPMKASLGGEGLPSPSEVLETFEESPGDSALAPSEPRGSADFESPPLVRAPVALKEERGVPTIKSYSGALAANEPNNFNAAARTLESSLAALRKSNATLEAQLKASKARSASLQKDLQSMKDKLMLAETEVERLAGVMKTRNQQTLTSMGSKSAAASERSAPAAQVTQVRRVESPRIAEDVLIGTVIADKANLRTGPGKDNSPFMTVPKGSRLTIETRNGDWYRVITPTGTRAWVASEVLAFGDTSQASPSRTIRIRGYDSRVEDEALKLVSNSVR